MVAVDSDPLIVVGIDFGTTFSGAAWARSGKPDRTATITNWPTKLRGNHDVEKAPTQIAFAEHHSSSPSGPLTFVSIRRQRQHQHSELAEPVWGYNIPADQAALKWFKLLLLEDKDIPESVRDSHHLKDARAALDASGKQVIEVVSAYLKALWAHIVTGIKRTIGDMLFSISTIQVVITLPAIWPHYAQARMRQAATAAGILATNSHGAQASIAFVPEPEAAALATFQDMTNRPDIRVDDHFVVCDAGGGTVVRTPHDLISCHPILGRCFLACSPIDLVSLCLGHHHVRSQKRRPSRHA
jgi:molecular chaperone DnaK (HSP70)